MIAALCLAPSALAQRYGLTNLGVLPGFEHSEALGINNAGQITGYCKTYNPPDNVAFFYEAGEMTQLPMFPGDPDPVAYAYDINNLGEISGQSDSDVWPNPATSVAWDANHQIHNVNPDSGFAGGAAFGINDNSVVVGVSDGAFGSYAYFWRENLYVQVPFRPEDINNLDQIVGWYDGLARLWDNGETIDLPPMPGHLQSYAMDINDLGQIVGMSKPGDGSGYAPVTWDESGDIVHLGKAHPTMGGAAEAINNRGEIAVSLINWDEYLNAFLWRRNLLTAVDDLLLPPAHGVWKVLGGDEMDINDQGQICGRGQELPALEYRAVRLDPVDTGLTLWSFEPNEPGAVNELTINHATPNGRVVILYGFARGEPAALPGPLPTPCAHAMTDIVTPRLAGSTRAEEDGTAYFRVHVPANARGRSVILQAIDASTCEVSPPSWVRFPDE
jgi:hypothetical protein